MNSVLSRVLAFSLLAPIAGAAALAQAAPVAYNLLVGSYSQTSSNQGIQVYRFDSRSGAVSGPIRVIKASNPSFLTLSRDGGTLFVVNENGQGDPGDTLGRVTSYRFEPDSGRMQQISQVKSLGDQPTYASLSADGRFLFVANYAVQPEGSLAVLPVQANGVLSPVAQIEFHGASHVDPQRQSSSHPHAAVLAPDGRQLYVPDLGADKVFIYRYDGDNLERPLSAAEPAFAPAPPGSGPRHLVFGDGGRFAYLTLELTGQVMVFAREPEGALRQLQIYGLAPDGFTGKVGAGALHLSRDGRFLYVLNRGDDNHLVVFAVNAEDGTLSFVQRRSVEGSNLREFSLDPSGRFLLVANQDSDQIKVFARDSQSGEVGKVLQTLSIGAPADLKFTVAP